MRNVETAVSMGASSAHMANTRLYQHATRDRDKAIAMALGDLVRDVRSAQSRGTREITN